MSDSRYELQRLVTVGTFSTPWEAQIAKARLAAEGVHSLIADEHLMRMVALANATGGIQLKVREPDAAAAAEVLLRLAPLPEIYLVSHDGSGSSEPPGPAAPAGEPGGRCPSCGSHDLQLERSSRLMLGVLPIANKGYRCGECGTLWKSDEVDTGRGTDFPEMPAEIPAGNERGAGDDDADAPLTTIARFHTPWEAHLARTVLESEGVRCCVLEQRLPAVHLLSAEPTAFNRLEVRGGDAARAVEILARAWSYPSLVETADPEPEDGPATD